MVAMPQSHKVFAEGNFLDLLIVKADSSVNEIISDWAAAIT